jgi:hypothetical protein
MGTLYDEAAHEDKKIADRWRTRTREDLRHELTVSDIEYIVGPVFHGGAKITEKQGKALILILEPSKLTRDAVKRVRRYADSADLNEKWKLVHLVSDAELGVVYKALRQDVVAKIIFKSPGTGITYAPVDYNVIARLIYEKEIAVYQARAGGFSRVATSIAFYIGSNKNRLVLNELVSPDTRTEYVVHESTHAIQGWEAVRSLVHHNEADAYIAGAIAAAALRNVLRADKPPTRDGDLVTIDAAAQLVIDKRADAGNKDWTVAYQKVVDVVAKFYKDKAGVRSTSNQAKSKVFKRVLAAAEVDAWKPQDWERYQQIQKTYGFGSDPAKGEKVFKRLLGKQGAERML